jgi:integrase
MTFAEVVTLFAAAKAPGWSDDTKRQWHSSMRDHVLPVIGNMQIGAIETGDVTRVLEPKWHSIAETMSRVRGRIEDVLDYAATRGWRSGDNPARWRGHLANLLPTRQSVRPVEHYAAMPFSDLPAFVAQLVTRNGTGAKCLTFLILTCTRSGEARGARLGEFDLQRGVWEIPAARMKARQPHRIPLPDAVLDIVKAQIPDGTCPDTLIFPGAADPSRPLFDTALSKLLPVGCTVHGMRSTFRDWAGETTNHPREVVEQALAHKIGDQVERAYARGDQFQKRIALMNAWADHCMSTEPAAA